MTVTGANFSTTQSVTIGGENEWLILAEGFRFYGQEDRLERRTKIAAYEDVLRKTGAKESEVAYLGDDLPDLTVMKRVGLAVAVADALPEVRRAAHYTTKAPGGKGAARELVEVILKSKGIWEEMIDKARA